LIPLRDTIPHRHAPVMTWVFHRLFILPRRERPRRFGRDEVGIEGAWAGWP
jgi:hypothetical protein